MKKVDFRKCAEFTLKTLGVALLAFLLDYLIVLLSKDESIWLGESIEVIGSVLFGPVVGGMATLINCSVSDYLMYGGFEYSYLAVLEIISVTMIGVVYRRLSEDDNRFGVKEIVIFN